MCYRKKSCKNELCPFKHNDMVTKNNLETDDEPEKSRKKREEDILNGFQNDMKRFSTKQTECGIDNANKKCNECDFITNSHGVLKRHENTIHSSNHTYEVIMEGFEDDNDEYIVLLTGMYDEEEFNRFACEKCSFKTHSEGTLPVHVYDKHEVSPGTGDH
jgi:hypothetical protein